MYNDEQLLKDLPVLQNRVGNAHNAPLAKLMLPADTELYLGLTHHNDHEGDFMRITVAHNRTMSSQNLALLVNAAGEVPILSGCQD